MSNFNSNYIVDIHICIYSGIYDLVFNCVEIFFSPMLSTFVALGQRFTNTIFSLQD